MDAPGNLIGFTELMRLTFEQDKAGSAIFATMDEELLETLYKLYEGRRRKSRARGRVMSNQREMIDYVEFQLVS